MDVKIVSQPISSTGANDAFGHHLRSALVSGKYSTCLISVAYVLAGGVALLARDFKAFKQNGGTISVVAGIGNGLTSVQGIEQLLLAGVTVHGFQAANILYHPKFYLLRGETGDWLSVGSSNLTPSGLFRNLEANVILTRAKGDATVSAFDDCQKWIKFLLAKPDLTTLCDSTALKRLLRDERLEDERVKRKARRKSSAKVSPTTGGNTPVAIGRVAIPGLPIPALAEGIYTSLSSALNKAKKKGRERLIEAELKLVARGSQFFAMTMSAFDCSHKTGVPGTPEIAIPESVARFFPPIGENGRKYPDVYFPVRINLSNGASEIGEYRLWQRPPGSKVGHADWRINIGHLTIDETSDGGHDLILFQRTIEDNPPYEVWIIKPGTSRYSELLTQCTQQVSASGAAGVKRYGIFG